MKCLLATSKHSLQAARLTYGLAYVTCPVMRPIHLNQDMVSRDEYVSTEKAIAGDVVQIVAHSQTGEHMCHITLVCGAHAAFNVLLECLHSKCTSVISCHATIIMPCCCLRRSGKGLICKCNQYTSYRRVHMVKGAACTDMLCDNLHSDFYLLGQLKQAWRLHIQRHAGGLQLQHQQCLEKLAQLFGAYYATCKPSCMLVLHTQLPQLLEFTKSVKRCQHLSVTAHQEHR